MVITFLSERQFKALITLLSLLFLLTFSTHASAAMDQNVMDQVLTKYQNAASAWSGVMIKYATWLFWSLVLISMVWNFTMLLLQGEGLTAVLAEMVKFFTVTGFFFWILINGPAMSMAIIKSMWQIGAEAIGQNSSFTPGGVTQIGFDIFFQVLDQSSVWSPVESTAGILLGLLILAILALVGVNLLLLFISAWILVYGGTFFLGFGGSRWTSDMAIGYFKTVLSTGAQLMSMVLIIGIGKSILDTYYSGMSGTANLKEMSVIFVVAIALLFLSNKIPALIGGIAGGSSAGIGGLGAGALIGAAAGAAAIAATGGALAAAGATQAAGGVSALQAAFEAANAAESGGGGGASGGGSGGSGGSGGEDTGSFDNAGPSGSNQGSNSGSGSGSSKGASSGFASSFSKAGRMMSNMASSLASGTAAHTSNIASSKLQAAKDAISQTTGGQIASQIRAQTASQMSGGQSASQDTGSTSSQPTQESTGTDNTSSADSFNGDSLSGGQDSADTGNVQDDVFENFKNKQSF